METGYIVDNLPDVSNFMDENYVNITQTIGHDHWQTLRYCWNSCRKYKYISKYDSIPKKENFSFSLVTTEDLCNKLKNVKIKKAPGYDGIPPKPLV